MYESFPLHWPTGREKTKSYQRRPAPFKITMAKARNSLLHQLKKMGATSIVISSNIKTYTRAGQEIMYADQGRAKEDPGVAVYYLWKSEQYSLACDKWNNVCDNLQALNKTVEAIRGIERWGSGEMMKAAFAGFKALPEAEKKKPWWEVLGISINSTGEEIKTAYRAKAMQHHPDRGGDRAKFIEVTEAYNVAIKK